MIHRFLRWRDVRCWWFSDSAFDVARSLRVGWARVYLLLCRGLCLVLVSSGVFGNEGISGVGRCW